MRLARFAPLLLALSAAVADEPKAPPRAPADHVVLDTDRAGASFVARPLKEQYDSLLKRVAALREEIAEARIEPASARREIDELQAKLKGLRDQIDATKLYIAAATVQTRSETKMVPLGSDDLLLIDASDVEIRGGDGPEIKCVLEKTVLGDEPEADFGGIELVARRVKGDELFGFYRNIAGRAEWKAVWDRFAFKDHLGQEFPHVTIKGLTGQEGNRQVSLEHLNEGGEGSHRSQWRRHARLTLYVPKCRRVSVRGALGGFKVNGLDAPLTVAGEGDRDYLASYEVSDLGGPLTADNLLPHRLDRIRGDVSIVATAYSENTSTHHGPKGVTIRPHAPRGSSYREIGGGLRVRACRADLSIERVSGRVDVENDFGRTTWSLDGPPAATDHRLVSQSGTIALHLGPEALGGTALALFTECGAVHLAPELAKSFDSKMFSSAEGDTLFRSWDGFTTTGREAGLELFERVASAFHGRPRPPGLDVISRAGTIVVSPASDAGAR